MTTEVEDVKSVALTGAEFNAHIKKLIEHFNQLNELGDSISGLPKGQKITQTDGATMGRKELRTLRSQFSARLKEVAKLYTNAKKKVKTTRSNTRTNGFKIPIVVKPAIQAYFKEANIGLIDPANPSSGRLNEALQMLLTYGITSPAILTPLFCIASNVNHLQDPENPQYLRGDELIAKHFGANFAELSARPAKVNKKGVTEPAPTLHRFKYATYQSLVAMNRVNDESLWNDNQKQVIKLLKMKIADPDVSKTYSADEIAQAGQFQAVLQAEQTTASGALDHYRKINVERVKLEKTEKKKAKAVVALPKAGEVAVSA